MLWISSHQSQHQQARCKPLWLKSLPRKGGWTQEQVQKSKALSEAAAKLPWAVEPEKEILSAPAAPRARARGASRGRGSCRRGLPGPPGGSRARSSRRWTWRRVPRVGGSVGALRRTPGAPSGRWGAAKGALGSLEPQQRVPFLRGPLNHWAEWQIYLLMVLVIPCFSLPRLSEKQEILRFEISDQSRKHDRTGFHFLFFTTSRQATCVYHWILNLFQILNLFHSRNYSIVWSKTCLLNYSLASLESSRRWK